MNIKTIPASGAPTRSTQVISPIIGTLSHYRLWWTLKWYHFVIQVVRPTSSWTLANVYMQVVTMLSYAQALEADEFGVIVQVPQTDAGR